MNILSSHASSRPRERLMEKGVEALSDAELLALILRTGTRSENVVEMSQNMLNQADLPSLSRSSLATLSKFKGIGVVKASQLIACFEISRRLLSAPRQSRKKIDSAEDVAAEYMPRLLFLKKENFIAIYLDARRKILREVVLSVGDIDTALISPRDVFHNALLEGASAIILVHNHPSGDSSPSEEDIAVTQELCAAGKLLGVQILDHIVIGDKNYSSMRDLNLI